MINAGIFGDAEWDRMSGWLQQDRPTRREARALTWTESIEDRVDDRRTSSSAKTSVQIVGGGCRGGLTGIHIDEQSTDGVEDAGDRESD